MEVEKICKEELACSMRGEPTVRFTYLGVVFFNKSAVSHLGLYDKKSGTYCSVHICRDVKNKADFGVFKDGEGWLLRKDRDGAVFNSAGLARHVIDATWDRCCHAVGAVKPSSMVFRIARLPLDDDKNKDVFALLRNKS